VWTGGVSHPLTPWRRRHAAPPGTAPDCPFELFGYGRSGHGFEATRCVIEELHTMRGFALRAHLWEEHRTNRWRQAPA